MDSRINTQTNVVAQVMGRLDGFTLAAELLKLGNLFDGAFAFDPKTQLSGWDSVNLPNIEITFPPRNVPEKTDEMCIGFYNNTDTFAPDCQVTHLRPGQHEFAGEWAASRLIEPAGLHWILRCEETSDALGKSDAFATSSPRSAFSVSFAVPEQNCDFRLFSLENANTDMPNAQIDGDLEFRDPKITGAVP